MKKIIITIIISILLIISSLALYTIYFGSHGLKIKEYVISNDKLDDSFYGIKIVHLSDINYGTTIKNKELEKIVNKINYLRPDIVVITGDTINKNVKINDTKKQQIITNFSKIEATLGKYIITGEQDKTYEFFDDIVTNSGFTNLDNSIDLIYNKTKNPILIAGLSTNNQDNNLTNFYEYQTNNPDNNLYKILLIHKPDDILKIDYNQFDLILAGHSLGGEINLPLLSNKFEGSKTYYKSYYKLNNTKLYISNGLGNLKGHYRFNNKPSINLFRLKK